jgi:hypothetical protein
MHRSNGQLHENARVKAAIPFVSPQSKVFSGKNQFFVRVMIFFLPEVSELLMNS